MLDAILTTAAATFLVGTGVRQVLIGWRQAKAYKAVQRTAEAERAALQARVSEIAERRTREREQANRTWQGFRKFVVSRKVLEAIDVRSFHLEPLDRQPLPGFHPGQYLTFKLQIPGQPRPVTRCYSLSEAPRSDRFRVTVKRMGGQSGEGGRPAGTASCYLHDEVEVGDIVEARAPAGAFWLDPEDAFPVVLVGGGVGVTPVLAMLEAIVEAGNRRDVWFFYGVRDGAAHAMAESLQSLAARHRNVRLHVCYSHPGDGEIPGARFQHVGHVTVDLIRRHVTDLRAAHVYVCGPPPMMKSLIEGLAQEGVDASRVHHEAFGPASVMGTSGSVSTHPGVGEIQVSFTKSALSVAWDGSATLLEMAEQAGIAIESGCRAGNCGSCLTRVRRGKVDYPTPPGADVPAGSCLACVATPVSALEIEA